ncbi:MAG: acetate--CoA ligase family protein, partial [Candidatus Binatia bacterium]
ECIRDPQRFLGLAERALELGKPLVALRAGSSEKGARTILAHTGALAGSRQVYEAVFRGKGILQAESYDDLVGMIEILAKARQLPRGGRLGVITTSGGSAGVLADNCALRGIELPELSDRTSQEISQMQTFGTAQNPLDLTDQVGSDPKLFQKSLDLLLGDEAIDILLLIFTNVFGQLGKGILDRVTEVLQRSQKPMVTLLTGGSITDECIQPVQKGPLPLFKGFHECLRSIKAVADYACFLEGREKRVEKQEEIVSPGEVVKIRDELIGKTGALTEEEAKTLLSRYHIPVAREGLAKNLEEAQRVAAEIGYPVAMKVVSPQILHKTEAQVIQLNVRDEKELAETLSRLHERVRCKHPSAEIKGVLIQEMVTDGMEVIVGISRDPTFGLTVLFGMGGIYTELLQDVSLRLVPVTRREAWEMIREVKGYDILAGARGRPRGDIEGVATTICNLSRLAEDLGDLLSAVDINPLIVRREGLGVKGVDALVVLKKEE